MSNYLIIIIKKHKKGPPRTCSLIGCRSSPMYFSFRTHSHSRIVNRRQLQIFSMPNISRASAILSDRIFDNSHCVIVTRGNEHRFASDFGHLLAISQKTCRRVKIRAKIMQCELGIRQFKNVFVKVSDGDDELLKTNLCCILLKESHIWVVVCPSNLREPAGIV